MSTNTGNMTPDGVAMVMAKGIQEAARHLDRQFAVPGIEHRQLEALGLLRVVGSPPCFRHRTCPQGALHARDW